MTKYTEFSEREVENIKQDALTAIDALNAIVTECDSGYVSRRYLREKALRAKWCIEYINAIAEGGNDD